MAKYRIHISYDLSDVFDIESESSEEARERAVEMFMDQYELDSYMESDLNVSVDKVSLRHFRIEFENEGIIKGFDYDDYDAPDEKKIDRLIRKWLFGQTGEIQNIKLINK